MDADNRYFPGHITDEDMDNGALPRTGSEKCGNDARDRSDRNPGKYLFPPLLAGLRHGDRLRQRGKMYGRQLSYGT